MEIVNLDKQVKVHFDKLVPRLKWTPTLTALGAKSINGKDPHRGAFVYHGNDGEFIFSSWAEKWVTLEDGNHAYIEDSRNEVPSKSQAASIPVLREAMAANADVICTIRPSSGRERDASVATVLIVAKVVEVDDNGDFILESTGVRIIR